MDGVKSLGSGVAPEHAGCRYDPEVARPVLVRIPHRAVRHAVFKADFFPFRAGEPIQAAGADRPDASLPVLLEGPDEVLVANSTDTPRTAESDPQAPVGRAQKAQHPPFRERCSAERIPRDKANTI